MTGPPLQVFLPILVFGSALSMQWHKIKRLWADVALLAIAGIPLQCSAHHCGGQVGLPGAHYCLCQSSCPAGWWRRAGDRDCQAGVGQLGLEVQGSEPSPGYLSLARAMPRSAGGCCRTAGVGAALFGAITSAIDPIAVVAVIKSVSASATLGAWHAGGGCWGPWRSKRNKPRSLSQPQPLLPP